MTLPRTISTEAVATRGIGQDVVVVAIVPQGWEGPSLKRRPFKNFERGPVLWGGWYLCREG